MTMARWLRAGLVFLTVTQLATGGWQLIFPRSFFTSGPLPTNPWVAMLPPYNEHLMRDVGALNLALAVVFVAATVAMERRLVLVALTANLTFTVAHFTFHATHLHGFDLGNAIGQTIALGFGVVLPVVLLVLAVRLPRR
ncbi:MAG: hypothetical protein GEV10_13570 [Streptosporangiales bacterium]|nr:hypothetical protein [Streptosporangiales bacterium]